jgi:CRISPR-associated protein Cmr1
MTASWHDLRLRAVTPAFLGRFEAVGPDPAPLPFPVPSLRGVLAYWLRALAGAHVGNDIGRLHGVESAVFGTARTADGGGPSPILLRADRVQFAEFPAASAGEGLRYLMGPGLVATKKQNDQKQPPYRCLLPPSMPQGTLRLRVRNTGMPAHADLFLSALWALRTFGGIGARTRRGFGTLTVDEVPEALATGRFDPAWLARDTVADLDAVIGCAGSAISDLGIASGTVQARGGVPSYPCFVPGQYQLGEDRLTQATDWRRALDITGDLLFAFRHGADRPPNGPPPPRGTHSQSYTEVVQPFLNRRPQHQPLIAGALGLPVPYSDHQGPPRPEDPQRKPTQRTAMVEVLIDGKLARRASPLWLRVCHDGSAWRLRSLAFYAEWLPPPERARLRITSGRRSADVDRPTEPQVRAELQRWFGPSADTGDRGSSTCPP